MHHISINIFVLRYIMTYLYFIALKKRDMLHLFIYWPNPIDMFHKSAIN